MLSIIVRCFNVTNYIDDCIVNIVSQKYRDIEVICINDASTDNTLSKLNVWSEKDNRLRIVNFKENHGISFALNVGIKEARGEYITIIDGDDFLINDNYFNACIQQFESDHYIDIVTCKSVLWDNTNNLPLSQFEKSNPQCIRLNEDDFIKHQGDAKGYLICSNSPRTLWCNIYRKTLFDYVPVIFPSRDEYPWSAEDALWVQLLYAYARKIKLVDLFVYLYNWHPGSFSRLKDRPNLSKFNKEKYEFIEEWWIAKIEELNNRGFLKPVGSPLIKWLIAAYPSTGFGDKHWVKENIIDKYQIDLTQDNYVCVPKKNSRWSRYDEWQNRDFRTAMKNEGILTNVELFITNACSLRCKKCSNLCQFVHKPKYEELESVYRNIDELMRIIPDETLFQLKIIGGEPFMYKQLDQVLLYAHKYADKYHSLVPITNGTIIPSESVLQALKKTKSIVNISDYGKLSYKRDELCKILDEHDIEYTLFAPPWVDLRSPRKKVETSHEIVKQTYDACRASGFICPQINNGRYFQCTFLCDAMFAGLIEDNPDNYLILKNAKYDDIIKINTRSDPFNGCKYCNGCNPSISLPTAEQTDRVLDFPQIEV